MRPPSPSELGQRGILGRLLSKTKQEAQRTLLRLHRNLSHPTDAALIKALREHKANDLLIGACEEFTRKTCAFRQKPVQAPKTGLYKGTYFNHRVQADTMWLKIHRENKVRALPILIMSDTTTRLVSARLLPDEQTTSFQSALERTWIRHFGPMEILQVDEHRGWASDSMKEWCAQHHIEIVISPGQAHERLAILERRHQVIRRALELFSMTAKTTVTRV